MRETLRCKKAWYLLAKMLDNSCVDKLFLSARHNSRLAIAKNFKFGMESSPQ